MSRYRSYLDDKPIPDKDPDELAEQIRKFQEQGGKIRQIPRGVTGLRGPLPYGSPKEPQSQPPSR
jgi:hypothetical protein